MKKDNRFEMYDAIIRIEEETDLRKQNNHVMTVRMPKTINEELERQRKLLKEELGVDVRQNEYINYILMHYVNMKQSDKGIVQVRNGSSFHNFLEKEGKRLIEHKKNVYFNEKRIAKGGEPNEHEGQK